MTNFYEYNEDSIFIGEYIPQELIDGTFTTKDNITDIQPVCDFTTQFAKFNGIDWDYYNFTPIAIYYKKNDGSERIISTIYTTDFDINDYTTISPSVFNEGDEICFDDTTQTWITTVKGIETIANEKTAELSTWIENDLSIVAFKLNLSELNDAGETIMTEYTTQININELHTILKNKIHLINWAFDGVESEGLFYSIINIPQSFTIEVFQAIEILLTNIRLFNTLILEKIQSLKTNGLKDELEVLNVKLIEVELRGEMCSLIPPAFTAPEGVQSIPIIPL